MEESTLTDGVCPAQVLLLGDPALRRISKPVDDFFDSPVFHDARNRLMSTLADFRQKHGFGRAIAAPQIGIPIRAIAVDLGDGPFLVSNPNIEWKSNSTFVMWDDCMSFPGLLVRVERYESISLTYTDESGAQRRWDRLGVAEAELLQHEIDHLNGVLAVDRAVGDNPFVLREAFDANREYFRRQVDYVISG